MLLKNLILLLKKYFLIFKKFIEIQNEIKF